MHRIVVKLGTNVIMRPDGKVALGLLCGLVEQIAALRDQGMEVLVVSSGAVGLGVERLGLSARPTVVAQVQACAAIGQSAPVRIVEDRVGHLLRAAGYARMFRRITAAATRKVHDRDQPLRGITRRCERRKSTCRLTHQDDVIPVDLGQRFGISDGCKHVLRCILAGLDIVRVRA